MIRQTILDQSATCPKWLSGVNSRLCLRLSFRLVLCCPLSALTPLGNVRGAFSKLNYPNRQAKRPCDPGDLAGDAEASRDTVERCPRGQDGQTEGRCGRNHDVR